MNELNKEINVLITDGEVKFSIHVIKCLSKYKNIKIHLLSEIKWVEMRFSKNISSFRYYSDINQEKDKINLIKEEVIKRNINVIFPVNVRDIRLLIKYKNELERLVPHLILPSTESFETANNKWCLFKLLEKYDLNRPLTFNSNLINKIDLSKIQFPVIIKPLDNMAGNGIKKIDSKILLSPIIKKKEPLIVQEFIEGFDIDMSVLCENGNILAYTIQKGYILSKEPFSMPHGVNFLGEKEIYNTIKILMQKLEWSGIAHIDLRFDEKENNFKVIEINPRVWGSIELSKSVGVNFPYLYCLTSLGVKYEIPKYRYEKCVSNIGLIKVLKSKLSKERIKYPDNTVIVSDFLDPIPMLYKLFIQKLTFFSRNKIKFLQKFRHDVY